MTPSNSLRNFNVIGDAIFPEKDKMKTRCKLQLSPDVTFMNSWEIGRWCTIGQMNITQ